MPYAPMGPYTLADLSKGSGNKDGMHKQSSGTHNTKVNFPSPTPGTNELFGTSYDRGAFRAPGKVKGMVTASINPDARDSGFAVMAHTGKN